MSIQLQLRRGNTSVHNTFTGAIAEVTVDTTKHTIVVHDGNTAGGFPLALYSDVANVASNISALTTANVVEGANLYYTNVRVYANVSPLLALKANITDLTTANVAELNNLYYTNARVKTYLESFNGNIIPSQNVVYTLGNATHRFKDLFLSGTTIDLGGISLKNEGGSFKVEDPTGNLAPLYIFTSNVIESGSTTSGNVFFSNARVYSNVSPLLALKANVVDLTTSNVAEGSNLYYTNVRVYSNVTPLLALKANVVDLTTANVSELDNLYYTNARVYANVTPLLALKANVVDLTTSNVIEGSNLYYTNSRVYSNVTPLLALKANVVDLTTSNVAEGSNLYFTNERVYSNVVQLNYATVTYVNNEIANLVASAPTTLDTLNELAAALGNDNNFATTTITLIGTAFNQANAALLATGNVYNVVNTKANVNDLNTSNIAEGSNLYFTNARVFSNVKPLLDNKANVVDLTTANVSELTNLYYTNARVYANVSPLLTGASSDTANALALKANIADLNTSNIAEGSNLYFTNARVYSNVNPLLVLKANVVDLTTANVAELTNLYYTNARVYANVTGLLNSKANVADLNTSNVTEGSNLYFTNTRVYANVSGLLATKANVIDLTTSNVSEGSNLYFTNARSVAALTAGPGIGINYANGLIYSSGRGFSNIIVQGSSNLYASDSTTFEVKAGDYISIFTDNLNSYPALTISANISGSPGIDIQANGRINFTGVLAVNGLEGDVTLSTANIAENGNLYFTNARVYSNVAQLNYATTTYVDNKVANLVASAPAALDTLNELAAALGNDNNFATTTLTLIGQAFDQANTASTLGGSVYNVANTKANIADLTTANVTELTNLYYTNARVYANVVGLLNGKANVADLNSSNVVEGTNLYFTNARVYANVSPLLSEKANIHDLTTANVAEHNNLYFTSARARDSIAVTGAGSYDNTTGIITITGGVTSVGGATGAVSNVQLAAAITSSGILTTSNIGEGSNLYYTDARVYANVSGLLANKANVIDLTTANVAEVTNLYFTNARVYSNVISLNYITNSALTGYATNTQLLGYATVSNLALKANVIDLTTANVAEVTNLYFTNARSRAAISTANGLHYNNSTGVISSGLQIQQVDTANIATVTVANVITLQFDADSGFDVIDRANGIAKVQMNSTFKTWNVTGQANLVATGLDVMRFVAGNNISITTNANASPQEIRFDTTFTAGQNIVIDANGRINANVATGISDYGVFNGGNANLALTTTVSDPKTILVLVDGLTQIPNTDYTTSGTTLSFISIPPANSTVEVKYFGASGGGGGGGAATGFYNSTLSTFPTGDYGNLTNNSLDAFGINVLDIYNCMDPLGSVSSVDLGAF